VIEVIEQMAAAKQKPAMTSEQLLTVLEKRGLPETVRVLREP
jgi:hypothetical protein